MFIKPMLLDTSPELFESSDYIYEPKSNGVRMELISTPAGIKLFTRHGNDITTSIPEITRLDIEYGTTLDGELVCYSDPTTEDFEGVMSRIMAKSQRKITELSEQFPCTYVVFDMLKHRDKLITEMPLTERKKILAESVVDHGSLRKVIFSEDGAALFELIKRYELEGIVAKKRNSRYYVGKRPRGVWLKIINWRYDEGQIVGYHKDQFGWIIADQDGNYLGVVKFGASSECKREFYRRVVLIEESSTTKSIEPVKCVVKHRGYLKSGKLFTPVFVSFQY